MTLRACSLTYSQSRGQRRSVVAILQGFGVGSRVQGAASEAQWNLRVVDPGTDVGGLDCSRNRRSERFQFYEYITASLKVVAVGGQTSNRGCRQASRQELPASESCPHTRYGSGRLGGNLGGFLRIEL